MDERHRFHDRRAAGLLLAKQLTRYKDRPDVLVLALPRGGVPVGFEIARELHAPLDVFVVRKLGVPWQPELAMGAIAGNGVEVLNADVVAVPVAARSTCQELRREVDDIVCLDTPYDFSAVGLWYEDFTQTSDEEVHRLLTESAPPQVTVH